MSEARLGQLTGWVRRRPSSLEFWELFVTSDRLIWCFVGETFSSALLRADMGERARDELDSLTLDEIAAYNERNFETPLDSLSSLRLVRGTRFRRTRLEIAWNGEERTLYSTKSSDPQQELIETLADDPRLEGVSVETATPSSFFDRR